MDLFRIETERRLANVEDVGCWERTVQVTKQEAGKRSSPLTQGMSIIRKDGTFQGSGGYQSKEETKFECLTRDGKATGP